MATIVQSGDFVRNVMKALKEHGNNGALRLDTLAQVIGDNPHSCLDKVKRIAAADELLGNSPFELISAREQEGYGFSKEAFPRAVMPLDPTRRKRTRKARAAVENATGQEEPKQQVNYWPIVAVKDPARASIKSDLGNIADFLQTWVRDNYGDKYGVFLAGKSVTVRFTGGEPESDEDEDVSGDE